MLKSVLVSVPPGPGEAPIDVRVSTNNLHAVIVGQPFTIPEGVDRDGFIFPYPECEPRPSRFLAETMTWQKTENAEAYSVGTGYKVSEDDVRGSLKQWVTWLANFENSSPTLRFEVFEGGRDVAFIGFNRQALLDVLCQIPDEGIVLAVPLIGGVGPWRYASGESAVSTGSEGSSALLTVRSPRGAIDANWRMGVCNSDRGQKQAAEKVVAEIGWVRRVLSHIRKVAADAVRG